MMDKERSHQTGAVSEEICLSLPSENDKPKDDVSCHGTDKVAGMGTCRVCQCTEPDRRGNVALGFLGISPPPCSLNNGNEEVKSNSEVTSGNTETKSNIKSALKGSELVEFVSPTGEVFVCTADVELGIDDDKDGLSELGCACKGDLALAHYACALKWFINHGSTICEICSSVAKNVRSADFKKVLGSLKEYEALRERTVNGEPNPTPRQTVLGVDPDAVAAIRRQRLSEISLWFNPHNNNAFAVSRVVSEQPSAATAVVEEVGSNENVATKWAVEGTGILLATGLLTVTLAWLLAPHVGKVFGVAFPSLAWLLKGPEFSGLSIMQFQFAVDIALILTCMDAMSAIFLLQKTARNGLHILLGGVCALTVVVFFRFFVLTRIKYGPARYWAILFVFWFLVFGIWASRTHGAHTT